MKINRKKLFEDLETEINPDASVSTIAKEVADIASDSGTQLGDGDAENIAKEIENSADDIKADSVVVATKDKYFSESEISKMLDEIYEKNMFQREKFGDAAEPFNLLICGLPGSGKTSIVESWARINGIKLVPFNAVDDKIGQALNGLPALKKKTEENGDLTPSELMTVFDDGRLRALTDKKNKENCVVFVDEYNRQKDPSLRRVFMSFFNEKRNADGSRGFQDTLLFSVVAINPRTATDTSAYNLNQAELSRFAKRAFKQNSDKKTVNDYIHARAANLFAKLGIEPPKKLTKNLKPFDGSTTIKKEKHSKYFLARTEAQVSDISEYIVSQMNVDFTDDEQYAELEYDDFGIPTVIFNGREFTRALEYSNGDKDEFLKFADSSRWDPDVVNELHRILKDYHFDPSEYDLPENDEDKKRKEAQNITPEESDDDGDMFSDSSDESADTSDAQTVLGGLNF